MHSPHLSRLARICAFFIFAPGVASALLPPTVTKTFDPNPITDGSTGRLIITLTNPNGTDLNGANVDDVLPACMVILYPYDYVLTPGCYASLDAGDPLVDPPVPSKLTFGGLDPIPAGGNCQLSVKVVALDFPCDNQTTAPTATGAVGISPPASASWTDTPVTTVTYTASVSGGSWSDSTNFGGTAPASGDNMVFPVVSQNFASVDDVEQLIIPKATVSGGGYGFTSSSPSNVLSVGELYFNLPVASTVSWNIPLSQTQDLVIRIAGGGEPFLVAPITMAGTNTYVIGGNASLSHVAGTGNLGIDAGTKTIFMPFSPTFTGKIDLVSGTFSPLPAISQEIDIHGHGQLKQTGGPDAMITVYGHGSTRPFGSQPGTLSVGQISYTHGFHVVDIAPTPGVYSKMTSTGSITFSDTALQVNLSTLPNPGDTYNDIFSTTGSVSSCPVETFCNMATVEAHAVCTDKTVSVVIDANDGVFKWGGETCPPSNDSCEDLTCNGGVCTN